MKDRENHKKKIVELLADAKPSAHSDPLDAPRCLYINGNGNTIHLNISIKKKKRLCDLAARAIK